MVIEAYVASADFAGLRAFLRQGLAGPAWRGPKVGELRGRIEGVTTRAALTAWLVSLVLYEPDELFGPEA